MKCDSQQHKVFKNNDSYLNLIPWNSLPPNRCITNYKIHVCHKLGAGALSLKF